MKIYNRNTKDYEEEIEYEKEKIEFLYNTVAGRVLLKLFVARPLFSKLNAIYYKSKISRKDIKPFIEKHNISMKYWDIEQFKSFNDFFTRKREIDISCSANEIIAVADSKLMIYDISDDTRLTIKNTTYNIKDIIKSASIAKQFNSGKALVFRLAADNYHRHVFIDSGIITDNYTLNGVLHTVRPISEKFKIYSENTREITVIKTKNLGTIVEIDVGALLIGCMVNTYRGYKVTKLDEKGYFEYGGSTVVILINTNCKIDEDILEQSRLGYETKVSIGERIGTVC